MSVRLGEIELNQILENEYRIRYLEELVKWLIASRPMHERPTNEELQEMRQDALKKLQKKYPKSGIELRGE